MSGKLIMRHLLLFDPTRESFVRLDAFSVFLAFCSCSITKDCTDCRLARLHELKLCECCEEYEHYTEIFKCQGNCGIPEACFDCYDGKFQCTLCEEDNAYCESCFYDYDFYRCDHCENEFCEDCRPKFFCCGTTVCQQCVEVSGDFFICADCKKPLCADCLDHRAFCEICTEFYCDSCRVVDGCGECQLDSW